MRAAIAACLVCLCACRLPSDEDDDSTDPGPDAAIPNPERVPVTVRWSVTDFATGQTGCPAAYPRVRVQSVIPESDFRNGFEESFDCAAGSATVMLHKAGDVRFVDEEGTARLYTVTGKYDVDVQLLGAQEQKVHGESIPYPVDVMAGPTTVDAAIVPGANYLLMIWQLRSAADEDLSCSMAGVASVEMRYRDFGQTRPQIVDRWPCTKVAAGFRETASGYSMSSPVLLDTYLARAFALSASGTVLAETAEFSMTPTGPGLGQVYGVSRIPYAIRLP